MGNSAQATVDAGTTSDLFLPTHVNGVRVLVDEGNGIFRIDNSTLRANNFGLGYRLSKHIDDVGKDYKHAEWNSRIQGTLEGEWVRVKATASPEYYLPKYLNGRLVLKNEGGGVYMVDNSQLQDRSSGLGYRLSRRLTDVAPNSKHAPWNTRVTGIDEGDWVRVQVAEATEGAMYQVRFDGLVATRAFSCASEVVATLRAGTSVRLLDVSDNMDKGFVRGRIENPPSWISLEDSFVTYLSDRDGKQLYYVTFHELPVTRDFSRNSEVLHRLNKGTTVEVLEVPEMLDDGRLRARISAPVGWISLAEKFVVKEMPANDNSALKPYLSSALPQNQSDERLQKSGNWGPGTEDPGQTLEKVTRTEKRRHTGPAAFQ